MFGGAGEFEGEINAGCKFSGQMHSLIDGLRMKYIYGDVTGPMSRWYRRNYRHWLWSGNAFFVIDTVLAYTAAAMDWLLHFQSEYNANDNGSFRLKNGPAEAVVQMLYPPHRHREEIGLADHDPDKKIPHLVMRPEKPVESQQFITAICLDPAPIPNFEVLQRRDYVAIRARTQQAVEEIYLNLRDILGSTSTGLTIGEWGMDGKSLLESLPKLTACWSSGNSVEVLSDVASDSIQVGADLKPQKVSWNGKSVAPVYNGRSKLVALKRGWLGGKATGACTSLGVRAD